MNKNIEFLESIHTLQFAANTCVDSLTQKIEEAGDQPSVECSVAGLAGQKMVIETQAAVIRHLTEQAAAIEDKIDTLLRKIVPQ